LKPFFLSFCNFREPDKFSVQTYLLDDQVLAFYRSVFFAKKIQTVCELLTACSAHSQALFGPADLRPINDLCLPIKTFISQFIVQMVTNPNSIISFLSTL